MDFICIVFIFCFFKLNPCQVCGFSDYYVSLGNIHTEFFVFLLTEWAYRTYVMLLLTMRPNYLKICQHHLKLREKVLLLFQKSGFKQERSYSGQVLEECKFISSTIWLFILSIYLGIAYLAFCWKCIKAYLYLENFWKSDKRREKVRF